MRRNLLKSKLRSGEPTIGVWTRCLDAGLIEFLGYQGWDFCVFDGEHGPLDPTTAEHLIRVTESRNVTSLVRVNNHQQDVILRYLDVGSEGIIVPRVDTAQQASSIVQSAKYPPIGQRGLGGVRAANFAQNISFRDHVQQSNDETFIMVQIESSEAVNNIEEILNVDYVDAIFIGQVDLSLSLGVPGDTRNPIVVEAVEHILSHTKEIGMPVGTLFSNPEGISKGIEAGFSFIAITLETLLSTVSKQFLQSFGGKLQESDHPEDSY